MRDMIWRCRDGTLVPVRRMSDRHLHNCIVMIQRLAVRGVAWRTEYLDRLLLELTIRSIERS